MLAIPDPRRTNRANAPTNVWWSFLDSTGMIYMHWVPTRQTVNSECNVDVLREFRKRFRRRGQHSWNRVSGISARTMDQSTTPSLSQTILPRWGIKTVLQPPSCPDLAPCDFWLLPKLRSCHYETIEEMKEAVTKVIDTLTQLDFHGAFRKLMERYNKCIAAGGDYLKRTRVLCVCYQ